MPDVIFELLLLLTALLLLYLASYLFRRHPGAPVKIDPATRYCWLRGALIVYVILLLAAVILKLTVHNDHRTGFGKVWLVVWQVVLLGILFHQFIRARREFAALPASKRQPRPKGPSFFWQALFILLPVTVLAVFGFWAILHQRRVVEQEAQERAQEIIRTLPGDFGRLLADGLTRFDYAKSSWLRFEENVARWPADLLRQQILGNTIEINIASNQFAILKAAFPDWTTGVPPITSFILSTNGPLWQQQVPPTPPNWLPAMNAEQRGALAVVESADLAGQPTSDMAELVDTLNKTGAPAAAFTCAQFISLRSQMRNAPATNAVEKLLDFAGRHDDVITQSGLPLTTLALAEALRRSRECGPTAKLWGALRSEAEQGGILAPRLLDESAALVASNAQLSESVEAMKVGLAERQLRGELAAVLVQNGSMKAIHNMAVVQALMGDAITNFNGQIRQPIVRLMPDGSLDTNFNSDIRANTTTTNFWMNAINQRWLCLVWPEEVRSGTIVSNRPFWKTEYLPKAGFYPKSVVIQGVTNALAAAKISLPDYFAITCELEGEPLNLPAPWNRTANGHAGDLLAAASFHLTLPAILLSDPSDGPRKETPFESMPGHPQFSLQIHLADRHLLYARQQQFQLIFGSLIALSLLSAIIGLAAAWRAFRRQLQLNEQKSNFVSSVSHELRAPIASVRLMAENLERGKITEPAKQGEYFRFIVQECRRLSSLIENVLDFSRIEQGRKQYEFEPTNLVALAETTVKLMEPYAAEKDVRLEFHSELRTPNSELNLDGRAIQQALVNLIDNAVKHSPKGEKVTVGIESRADVPPAQAAPQREQSVATTGWTRGTPVLLYVTDHGPGIPAAEHERIFERFYRLGSELRRETQGVGIGLSVVKHIVEAHGGHVRVASEPGQGSRFTIELPEPNAKAQSSQDAKRN